MSGAYTDTPSLTLEQQAVVGRPVDAMVLVTAGAGAGKTHTLVRRLDRLAQEEELSSSEVLVLTFSRAAVRELRDRLGRYGDAARHVRVQTFDSWALELLMQVDMTGEWPKRTFDDRIQGATQAIDDGLADELFEDLRHVVIDEVQDLVGKRRELVEALLDRFECGFTIVGDPAQAIYGFTLDDAADRPFETNRFFDWLRNTFGEDLVELSLTGNHRADTDEAKIAEPFGPRLRVLAENQGEDGGAAHAELRSTLRACLNLGDLDEFVANGLAAYPGTTAVLCRTNGEALVVSERLHELGVAHRLQRSARDRVAPAWIALLLRRCETSMLSRSRFEELVADLPLVAGDSPQRLWRSLRRTGHGGGDRTLDLDRLRAALAAGRLPDELTAQPPAPLVVSSFHRAKGLEFDRVVVVDPGALRLGSPEVGKAAKKGRDVDTAEEARLLYVAMSRPRAELLWLNSLDMRHIRSDRKTNRWARYFWERWRRNGLEVKGDDVYTERPAGMRDIGGDAAELQEYMATKVRPGDEVLLERLHPDAIGVQESPPYAVLHDGRSIGTVSDRFRSDLYQHLKTSKTFVPRHWPRTIRRLRIDAMATVAGSVAAGIQAGLGDRGLWLAPRIVGLGEFTWDKKAQEEESDVAAQ